MYPYVKSYHGIKYMFNLFNNLQTEYTNEEIVIRH